MIFHFRLFPEKSNDKSFQKCENTILGAIFGPFYPKLDQWQFSRKIELRQFLAQIKSYIHLKN